MSQLTIEIPPELEARLQLKAERRQTTVDALAREVLDERFAIRRRRLLSAGAGNSGQSDISERIEEILRAELRP